MKDRYIRFFEKKQHVRLFFELEDSISQEKKLIFITKEFVFCILVSLNFNFDSRYPVISSSWKKVRLIICQFHSNNLRIFTSFFVFLTAKVLFSKKKKTVASLVILGWKKSNFKLAIFTFVSFLTARKSCGPTFQKTHSIIWKFDVLA